MHETYFMTAREKKLKRLEREYRDIARPIIARILLATKEMDETVIRTALYEAYPFDEFANPQYKIWMNEIWRQRGIPKKKTPELKCEYIQLTLFDIKIQNPG